MTSDRKNAIVLGVLFVLATSTAIIGLVLYEPILNDPDYLIKAAENSTRVILGVVIVGILSVLGTFSTDIDRVFIGAIVIGSMALIVWLAWKWPNPEFSPDIESRKLTQIATYE